MSTERYSPDAQSVVDTIRDALLGDGASEICDVTIRAVDGQQLPACRTLLAARSHYFRSLFFGDFAENNSQFVDISLPARILQPVLEFAYTGECHTVTDILSISKTSHLSKAVTPLQCRQHIVDLVDLGMAADYCQMDDLKNWCKDTLRLLLRAIPKAVCLLFDKIETQNVTTEITSRDRLIRIIASKPVECFALADVCAPHDPFAPRSINLDDHTVDEVSEDKAKSSSEQFGVTSLSEKAMMNLIPELLKCMSDRNSKLTTEYLFQVIQCWTLWVRHSDSASDDTVLVPLRYVRDGATFLRDVDEKRLQYGKILLSKLDLRSMNPIFVKDYVDGSQLADREELLCAYRHHATKNFHTASNVLTVDTSDEYGMPLRSPKFSKRRRRRADSMGSNLRWRADGPHLREARFHASALVEISDEEHLQDSTD